jgi:transposase
MEVVHPRCAGIDVSKRDAKVCVRVQGRGRRATSSTVTTWTSMTSDIFALREYLIAERVTCVVIESTAAYWKPFVRHEALENRVGVKGPHRWSVAAGW